MRRSINVLFLTCLAAGGLGTTAPVRAQAAANSQDQASAVRSAAKEYAAAVRRGDVDSIRRMWTPDGDYIDASGQTAKAKDLFRDLPVTPPANVTSADVPAATSTLRFITPDVAIEDGTFDGGTSDDGVATFGRFTAVWVKRDGRWLLDNLREAATTAQIVNENLRPLEWLIGEWAGEADGASMLVSAHWSEGGNYLVREFLVQAEGRENLTGEQRIGWDPATGTIKSWVFDSHGGSGVGSWKRDGDRWIVDSEEVMPDGKKTSSSSVFTPGGDGQFLWETKGGKVGDMNVPPRRVEFTRAAENE